MRASLVPTTILAAALAACGGTDSGPSVTCGTGTTLMDGTCVATGGSNTGGDTCGAGTHLDGTTCVPDDNTVQAAPTATSIDPPAAGLTGSVLFTITGTGFAGSNVTDLHVFFGDPTNANCEATLGTSTATTIAGEVPFACSLSPSVTVTIQTNLGTATLPFNYLMLFAGDGDGGGSVGAGGDVYVIDPLAQLSFDLGQATDANNKPYAYSGMDFDATGTLYGVTSGDSPADVAAGTLSQLVLIDLSTGAVTVKGPAVDADLFPYYVTDVKFTSGALYGLGFWYDGADWERTLVTISTVDGTVTPVGASTVDDTLTGGLAVDGAGTLVAAVNGAGADANSNSPTTGEYDTVNVMDGTLTSAATLDWPVGAPIQAMTTFPASTPVVLAIIDDGWYGAVNANLYQAPQTPPVGETLALIDPTATGTDPIVNPLFELPAQIGASTHVDALAVPPSTLVLARQLPKTGWTHLAAGTRAVR